MMEIPSGNSLPLLPLPSGNVIGTSTIEKESKPRMLVPGDWQFKVKNNGDTPWPAGTILTLDEREDLVDGITPIEIPIGEVPPSKIFTLKGIDIEAPATAGEYKYYFSFKTSKHGEYFGKKMMLVLKVISDVAAHIPARRADVEIRDGA
jgi:hypothetical protein